MENADEALMKLGHSIGADFVRDMARTCPTDHDFLYVCTGLVGGMTAALARRVGPGVATEVLENVIKAVKIGLKPS